jgi:hypothetical protein
MSVWRSTGSGGDVDGGRPVFLSTSNSLLFLNRGTACFKEGRKEDNFEI